MRTNLPTFLHGSEERSFKDWSARDYYDLFVAPVRAKYADLSIDWNAVPR